MTPTPVENGGPLLPRIHFLSFHVQKHWPALIFSRFSFGIWPRLVVRPGRGRGRRNGGDAALPLAKGLAAPTPAARSRHCQLAVPLTMETLSGDNHPKVAQRWHRTRDPRQRTPARTAPLPAWTPARQAERWGSGPGGSPAASAESHSLSPSPRPRRSPLAAGHARARAARTASIEEREARQRAQLEEQTEARELRMMARELTRLATNITSLQQFLFSLEQSSSEDLLRELWIRMSHRGHGNDVGEAALAAVAGMLGVTVTVAGAYGVYATGFRVYTPLHVYRITYSLRLAELVPQHRDQLRLLPLTLAAAAHDEVLQFIIPTSSM